MRFSGDQGSLSASQLLLDDLGLVDALEWYTTDFERRTEITCIFDHSDIPTLTDTIATAAYRISQEALTNVARHAQATRVDLFLEQRNDRVITIVEDNGVGFDIEMVKQQGRLGLLGMRERTEMLKGVLAVESTIDTGTTIYVEVPYEYSDSDS